MFLDLKNELFRISLTITDFRGSSRPWISLYPTHLEQHISYLFSEKKLDLLRLHLIDDITL